MAENENFHEDESKKETMLERGIFRANGYEFVVKPIYLMEEDEFLSDVPYSLYPQSKDGSVLTDKDLGYYAIAMFRNKVLSESEKENTRVIEKIKIWFSKHFSHTYRYYADNPSVLGLVKWVEKKVFYKGKPIKFYELERKFMLNKSEIVKLFGYLQDLSNFR